MKMYVFDMEIIDKNGNSYDIEIKHKQDITNIRFTPESRGLIFLNNDKITNILKTNEHQFRKVLHIKRKDTFYKGCKLRFALRDKKAVADFNDSSKIIVLDKRNRNVNSYVRNVGIKKINKIYTDGSFLEKKGKGGYVVIIENLKGEYTLRSFETKVKSSCLIELLPAIKGLEILKNIDKIKIITDSQYVRKGLTEWIINWKLNDWFTANGEKVKNIEYWKKFDKLTENKYIEFEWVKAHSNHFENTMCDLYAKDIANKT